jgi:hypothetical protein
MPWKNEERMDVSAYEKNLRYSTQVLINVYNEQPEAAHRRVNFIRHEDTVRGLHEQHV